MSAAIEYRIVVRNNGRGDARDVAFGIYMLSASARQAADLQTIFASPVERPVVEPFTIRAGDQGDIHGLLGNQLVRTRHAYAARGLAVMVTDVDTDLASAVKYMAAIKRPVTVIATSRGTLRAAEGIARGARPDALVLTSGFLSPESGSGSNLMSILGSPSALPRTLVIHHTQDGCRFTQPAGVEPFIKWSGGRAHVRWLSGGADQGNPCEARAHHGFNGLDGQVVGLAGGFH